MAMVQPIAQSVPAFDAKNDNTFTFVSNGGNQVVANKIVIRNNDTNTIVYENKITSYKFEQTVPANTLENGIYYNFYFTTFDINGEESSKSNVIPFKCFTTPIVEITNIPLNGIINSSNFTVNVKYSQEQGEIIDFAKIILFNQLGDKIFESENIYNTSTPPLTFNYPLKGLEDKTTYRVMAKVITINRTVVESEKKLFTTQYFTPELSSLIELENNCEKGYVKIKNNFYIVDSESNPPSIGTNPKYLKNGKLYLDEEGTWIDWNSGYNIQNDFTLRLFVENPKVNKNICTLKNKNGDYIILKIIEDYPYLSYDKKYCLELNSFNHNIKIPYIIQSDFVNDISKVMIWVRRINNIFEIDLYSYNDKTFYWESSTNIYWNSDEGDAIYWE